MAMAEPKQPSGKVHLTAPIAKTVETEDGGREVWGFATLERVDKQGEIADYTGTLKAFEKWSSDVEKRTGGKSKGNLRVMHGPTAAGKMIHWEPTETNILDDDGSEKTVKGIWTGAYIPPTKQDIIKDVDEGILSAFSIGGKYERRWYDEASKAFRYVPELSEYSLVDNPAVPGADIVQVVNKSDGPWNQENRNLNGGVNVDEEMTKGAPEGSYEELMDKIRHALNERFGGAGGYYDGYICATWPDKVIVYNWEQDKYWELPFSVNDQGDVVFGQEKQMEQEYVPAGAQKSVQSQLEKRKKKEDDKLHEEAEKRAKKYGISFKDGKGHLTPPKGKPTDAVKYGDPVNYAYPIDKDHIKAAVEYFNHPDEREKGGYTEDEWAVIGKRIASAAKSLEGGDYSYKGGKIVTPSEQKGAKKGMTKEDLEKAAAAAGISVEQMNAFIKAMAEDMPTIVSTVDGDGDGDHNKEFPNPPGPDEQIDIQAGEDSVKQSEEETGVAAKDPGPGAPAEGPGAGTEKADGDELNKADGELEKAGRKFSKKSEMHMKHAMHHIQAALTGTDYGPDAHLKVENDEAGKNGNTGEEAPPVDAEKGAFSMALSKAVAGEMGNVMEKFEAMSKGLVSLEKFNEAVSVMDELKKAIGDTQALVKEIHETPQPGGPMLGAGSPDLANFFKKSNQPQSLDDVDDTVLKGLMDRTTDPMVKDAIGQQIAQRQARAQLGK